MIGGKISGQAVAATLIDPEAKFITHATREALWRIFVEIGRQWGNLADESAAVKSSWLEFIQAKVGHEPSYAGEYGNAAAVLQELEELYQDRAFSLLFFDSGVSGGPPTTRLAHLKRYVVDEFIRVQVVASGFKGFGTVRSLNYKGYVGGSRFNRLPRVRKYEPESGAGEGGGQ